MRLVLRRWQLSRRFFLSWWGKKLSKKSIDAINLLSIFESGSLHVGINGRPLLKVDAQSRSLDVDTAGMKETGIRLSKLKTSEDHNLGIQGLIKTSRDTARGLSDVGWKLSVYDKGKSVLTMGSGVSRLTWRISANPLRLRRLLNAF
jgi:hypothetical protein